MLERRLVLLEQPLQEVQVADDDAQQIVEVMGDAASDLADGVHLLGAAQGLLGEFLFGNVLFEAQKVSDAAILVLDRGDGGLFPE